jgi:hypothetical protein
MQSRVTSRKILCGRSGTGAGFCPNSSGFLDNLISAVTSFSSITSPEMFENPDKATHNHTFGTKFEASSLTRNVTVFDLKE